MRISLLTLAATGGVLLTAATVAAQPREAIFLAPAWRAAAQEPAPAAGQKTINLNTATIEQLETLPGIGRKTAERIIEHREKVGAFKKVEELMNVKGIGEKSFLKIKPLLSVTPPKAEKASGA
jgi:competence protein ComEA